MNHSDRVNHERQAIWIKRIFLLVLAAGIVAGAWFYQKKHPLAKTEVQAPPTHEIELLHYHQPGDPASEQIADSLNRIAAKYSRQVLVTRLDLSQKPESAKTHAILKAPHVVFMTGETKAFDFQGLWAYPKIEFKVEEILRGLRRVGKDWLPEVKGMRPASATNGP